METTTDTPQALNPNKWLDCHGDYLYRYALVRVHDAETAEDLLQETLLAAVGSYQSHVGRSSERTWLVGIMKHKIIDYFRRVARNAQFQLMPEDTGDESEWFETSGPWQGHWREDQAPTNWTVHALESREFWQTLENCLSQLSPQMSIAFTLREIDGLTSTEICEILDITPNNLWVLLHRSRAKLRQLLESQWFQKRTPAQKSDLQGPVEGAALRGRPFYATKTSFDSAAATSGGHGVPPLQIGVRICLRPRPTVGWEF